MNCQAYDEQLGDFVDGTLAAAALPEVEAHLATCARCRAVVADFRTMRSMTLALEPHLPPPHVWAKLSSKIEAAPARWAFLPRTGFAWQPLAATAMAVVLTTGLWWVGGRLALGAPGRVAAGPASAAQTAAVLNPELQVAEQHLTTAITGLEQITNTQRTALDPETADVLQVNLSLIDNAIGESRAALKTEPENDLAQESLFEALRSKLALLQDTLALINEMRKGNPEGAARIVSGLNQ